MKSIAITGGKGGTGKSTVATALATQLVKRHKVLLVDCDVDCPNDHLILNVKQEKVNDIFQMVPKFDNKKCVKCGDCMRVCNSNAVIHVEGNYPLFFNKLCNGCNACYLACSKKGKAISQTKKKIGEIRFGKNHGVDLLSGFMEVGNEEPTPIVKEVKKEALGKKNYDYILFDTSVGTHCNVIAALLHVDYALAVTEPTPLGSHDLVLILGLLNELNVNGGIVINKSDVGNKKEVEKIAQELNFTILCQIPYADSILKAYSKGEKIEDKSFKKLATLLQ